VLDPLVVGGGVVGVGGGVGLWLVVDWWNFFGEGETDGLRRFGIEVNFFGLAVEVAGFVLPVLSFALFGREFDGVSIGEVESFIDVEGGLNVVVAGGDVVEAFGGISERGGVDDGGGTGGEGVDVNAEDLLGLRRVVAELEAGFLFVVVGDQEEDVAVERRGTGFFGEGDFEALGLGLGWLRGGLRCEGEQDRYDDVFVH